MMIRFYLTTYFLVTGARDTDLVTTSLAWAGTGGALILTTLTLTLSWTLRARAAPSQTRWTPAGTGTGAERRAAARRTRWPRPRCPRCLGPGASTTQAGPHTRPSPVWPAARARPAPRVSRPLSASTKLHRSSGDLTRSAPLCPRRPPTPWTRSPRSPSRSPSLVSRATSSSCQPRRPLSRRLEVRCSVSGVPRDLNI